MRTAAGSETHMDADVVDVENYFVMDTDIKEADLLARCPAHFSPATYHPPARSIVSETVGTYYTRRSPCRPPGRATQHYRLGQQRQRERQRADPGLLSVVLCGGFLHPVAHARRWHNG